MTSDAKVGLLLGLVFIFLIAFLINGLPRFGQQSNTNELTNEIVSLQNNPGGLATARRKVSRAINKKAEQTVGSNRIICESGEGEEDVESAKKSAERSVIRFKTPLPMPEYQNNQQKQESSGKKQDPLVVHKGGDIDLSEIQKQSASPKVYVVKSGDSLAAIAKEFYGFQQGNKKANVAKIFEANRDRLRSPELIYAGQKLRIPALSGDGRQKKSTTIAAGRMLETVKSIGRRHKLKKQVQAEYKYYTVKNGDSLWKIAESRLADGNCYKEIARLNGDRLESEDYLKVGMRLKIPTP